MATPKTPPKVSTAGIINSSQQFAASKTTPAKTTPAVSTANQRESRTPAPVQTFRPTAESFKPSPSTRTPVTSKTTTTKTSIPKPEIISPYVPGDTGDTGDTSGGDTGTQRTIVSRVPKLDSKGQIVGWTISWSDGTVTWENNPEYGKQQDASKSNPAYATISKILESYGITGLASVLEEIRKEYPEASSDDVITLLQFDDRYNAKFNQRFSANLDRQKAGMSVLSPGDYLALEQGYKKIFNAYNLPNFSTQDYFNKFIAADLKTTDIADRVSLAFDRVLKDEMVANTFKKFYPSLTTTDIVTGMLDPTNQFPALERKVRAAEIGGAALRQGLVATEQQSMEAAANLPFSNVTRGTLGADVIAQGDITKAQAEQKYQTIAGMLPDIEKISSIYGKTEAQYGRLEAEQELFQGLASSARKRQRLQSLEEAQYLKKSGLGKGALGSQTNL